MQEWSGAAGEPNAEPYAEPYEMSPNEVAWGYLFGEEPLVADGSGVPDRSPRTALEDAVRRTLERPPCGVAFSGGRDSSTILAVATHVARRDGLPLPVPLTRVFPLAPASEETEWQERVVRHLGLTDWQRIELTDELDLVGPRARRHLRAHGVIWPPMIHADQPLLDRVTGGSLIDGEGGDEVLGVDGHRIAPVSNVLRSPRPVRRARYVAALVALSPAAVRGRLVRRSLGDWPLDWLRPGALAALADQLARAEARRPLSYAASVAAVPRRRTQAIMLRNRRILAASRDVALSSPLTDPSVVRSLAADGGRRGRGTRTVVLRSMVGDLLPDAVLSRTSKATFSEAYLGRHSSEFAAAWSGDGLDDELVDAAELRRLWRSEGSNALTAALLQTAWLHDHADRGSSSAESVGAT